MIILTYLRNNNKMDNNFGMHTKIVGVTRKNDDGTDRQNLIADLSEGDQLTFEREYENEHDENAIAVYDCSGQQLGYLKSSVAEDVAPILDSGGKITGFVTEVTGGMGDESYGCNIRIEVFPQKDYCISDAHSNDAISWILAGIPLPFLLQTPVFRLCLIHRQSQTINPLRALIFVGNALHVTQHTALKYALAAPALVVAFSSKIYISSASCQHF
jgi:hypothetical protein